MKKLFLLALLLVAPLIQKADATLYSQSTFAGYMDQIYPDDLSLTQAASCLNVWFDEYTGQVTKREGCTAFNTTPLVGNLWVRNMYDYIQYNGTEYNVVQTSNSILVNNGGGYVSILNGIDPLARMDFTTAKNCVYGCNGYTVFFSSGAGSTQLSAGITTISTGVPVGCTLMKYMNNRMFYSGIAATPSIVWYSELNDPTNVEPFDYIDVNVSDGDQITGLFLSGGNPYCTKYYSTWTIPEVSVGVFQVRPVSLTIGCLYESTMQTYLGQYPMWMSSRGIEMYDGQFELISLPINNTILSLWQMTKQQSILTQPDSSNWGDGTSVNVSTSAFLGSIAFAPLTWTQNVLPSAQQEYSIAISSSTQIQLVATNIGVLLSTNYGVTWSTTSLPTTYIPDAVAMSLDGSKMGAVIPTDSGGDGAVYLSTGNGWYQVSGPDARYGIAMSSNGSVITAGDANYGVDVSTNTGINWSHVNLGIGSGHKISTSYNGQVQSVCCDGGGVAITTNTFATSFIPSFSVGSYPYQCSNYVSSSGVIMSMVLSVPAQVWVSTNTGNSFSNTWNNNILYSGIDDIAGSADGSKQIVLGGGTVSALMSSNYGATWSPASQLPSLNYPPSLMAVNPSATAGAAINSNYLNTDYVYEGNIIWSSGTYTTPAIYASLLSNWGTLTITDNQSVAGAGTISYSVATASTAYNLTTSTYQAIASGQSIPSNNGSWLSIMSNYSSGVTTTPPMTNSYTISYFGGNNMYPTSCIYKDRYYIGVSTNPTNAINDTVLVYDKNGQWSKLSGHRGSMALYRQSLYYGDSTQGLVYADDVQGLYTDNGIPYDSNYTTKMFDYRELDPGNSFCFKDLLEQWIRIEAIKAGTININYALDGSSTWTTLQALQYPAGLSSQKLVFPGYPKSKMFQLNIDDNYGTNWFMIEGFGTTFNIEPPQ